MYCTATYPKLTAMMMICTLGQGCAGTLHQELACNSSTDGMPSAADLDQPSEALHHVLPEPVKARHIPYPTLSPTPSTVSSGSLLQCLSERTIALTQQGYRGAEVSFYKKNNQWMARIAGLTEETMSVVCNGGNASEALERFLRQPNPNKLQVMTTPDGEKVFYIGTPGLRGGMELFTQENISRLHNKCVREALAPYFGKLVPYKEAEYLREELAEKQRQKEAEVKAHKELQRQRDEEAREAERERRARRQLQEKLERQQREAEKKAQRELEERQRKEAEEESARRRLKFQEMEKRLKQQEELIKKLKEIVQKKEEEKQEEGKVVSEEVDEDWNLV